MSDLAQTGGSFRASAGHTVAWVRWQTARQSVRLLFVHATGFCKELWRSTIEELVARGLEFSAAAIDQLGHGASTRNWDVPVDWWQIGKDIVQLADDDPFDMIVGHSSGAAGAMLASLINPGITPQLILIEPIVFPPPYVAMTDHPLVLGALRRRTQFDSRDAVYDHFHGRGPFSGWDDRVFDEYMSAGFVDNPEGSVRLACDARHEAEFYSAATLHGGWERMGEVAARTHVAAGELSDSHSAEFVETQRQRLNATSEILSGLSHFAPMQDPGTIADVVIRQLGTAAGS